MIKLYIFQYLKCEFIIYYKNLFVNLTGIIYFLFTHKLGRSMLLQS